MTETAQSQARIDNAKETLRRYLDLYWEHGSDFGSQVASAAQDLLDALSGVTDGT